MPVEAAPEALAGLRGADHAPASRATVDEHLRPELGQHAMADPPAERLNPLRQRRGDARITGDAVAAPDELRSPGMLCGSLALGQMRPADALLERGHQPAVMGPDVADQFPLV